MFDEWRVIICTQVLLSVSIVTACMPQFKRLLDCLQSGMLGTDDLRRRGQTGLYGYKGYSGKSRSKEYYSLEATNTDSNRKSDQKLRETAPHQRIRVGPHDIRMQTELTITSEPHSSQAGWDEESQHSTSRIVRDSDFVSTATHGI